MREPCEKERTFRDWQPGLRVAEQPNRLDVQQVWMLAEGDLEDFPNIRPRLRSAPKPLGQRIERRLWPFVQPESWRVRLLGIISLGMNAPRAFNAKVVTEKPKTPIGLSRR